jgi:hypothetical protein
MTSQVVETSAHEALFQPKSSDPRPAVKHAAEGKRALGSSCHSTAGRRLFTPLVLRGDLCEKYKQVV